jgi:hypothetical protein
MYRDGRLIWGKGRARGAKLASLAPWACTVYRSLVDPRVRALMYSRIADSEYLTLLPIFVNRGPSPFIRALASQESETLRSRAASRGCSSGSVVLALTGAFMSPPLSCLRWRTYPRTSNFRRETGMGIFLNLSPPQRPSAANRSPLAILAGTTTVRLHCDG